MKMIEKLAHFFIPRQSNNQKAKLIHSGSLIAITLFFIFYQLTISLFSRVTPKVLGYAANISPAEVIRLTNEKRVGAGLPALVENATLSAAAQAKGADMLSKGYWAHIAPDGTQPWSFFVNFGYKYRYAGENLARDFSSSSSAVYAWMNSPTHRENVLSPRYKEIGIGVVEGKLAGVDTTIIVQFFGTKYADTIPAPLAKAQPQPTALALVSTPEPTSAPIPKVAVVSSPSPQVLVSPFSTTKGLSLVIVAVLLLVLIIDAVIISRRKIARIGGRTFAHMAFLGMILAIALILKAGQII